MVNFENFATLHPDGRRLTIDFLEKARLEGIDRFAAFMQLWLSFNGWMACVTGNERDADMIYAVGNDRQLTQVFIDLMDEQQNFFESVIHFSERWPIFNAHDVRMKFGHNFVYGFNSREEFTASVINNTKIRRRPKRWDPRQKPQWLDLLEAIYQVRCNLFHGDKSPMNAEDRELVELAFITLDEFVERSRIYR